MIKYIVLLFMLPVLAGAQTLYVPNGTGGIDSSTNESVGIGTSTPHGSSKLDIRGGGIHVVNSATDAYTYIGRNTYTGNDSYFYHRMSPAFHIVGSNKNNGGILKGLGFAIGGLDTENDIKMVITTNGNVGIGTNSPQATLHMKTTAPWMALEKPAGSFEQGIRFSEETTHLFYFYTDNDGTNSLKIQSGTEGDASPRMQFPYTNNNIYMVQSGGNVGIGTINPDAKLTVKGDIHTREVRVDMDGPLQAPDYVFEKDYNLLSLSELEAYINQNKHLPEVPSAKEMETNGLNLKEMNLLLLKKVEELTLHLIEQSKIISKQNERITDLEKSK